MILESDVYLQHYGILRKSGRYPWGSGGNQNERNKSFLDYVKTMQADGLSESQIAAGVGISTTQLRAVKSIARNQQKQLAVLEAQKLRDKGYSIQAISNKLDKPESTVRTLLAPGAADVHDVLVSTSEALKAAVDKSKYIDIGVGVENYMGVSKERLGTAVAMLQEDGYEVHRVKTTQVATGHETERKVLVAPGVTQKEVWVNSNDIALPFSHSDDGGRSFTPLIKPLSVSSSRVKVVYAKDGGDKADGVIYVREGVADLSMGKARYAQVRIQVDDSHYLKGMAIYKKDLPKGIDLEFHTAKDPTGNKLDAMKKKSDDPDFPFGAVVRQLVDKPGSPDAKATSAINLVREEGEWLGWSRTISAQVLGKQPPKLAEHQLKKALNEKQTEFDEISSLTNPAVRKMLLGKFADGVDAAAVNLKAAAMPRQNWQVIIPVSSMKDNEVYAPNYRHGEKVVLIRYPHGGIFEIPELTVNNKNPAAKDLLGDAADAIGINHKVANIMSGADFDGDTVLVVPNSSKQFKTKPPLESLKDFDPIRSYPAYEGMAPIKPSRKQGEMGNISNLITDMTIRGASDTELAAAIRHSMVVIDSEKHNLNYKQSAIDNGIANLKRKYQGSGTAGASTLISRAKSTKRIPERKPRPMGSGGPIDKATGRKEFVNTNATYTNRQGIKVAKTTKVPALAVVDNARELVSSGNTRIEGVYADHSNALKALGNEARRLQVNTEPTKRSPSAAKTYSREVASLDAKLNIAKRNKPLERQAQTFANAAIKAKKASNPDLTPDQLKKVKFQELAKARNRVGSERGETQIRITDSEWSAIQAGAISGNKLDQILLSADLDRVRELATPKTSKTVAASVSARAESLINGGYPKGDVAEMLGVSLSTLNRILDERR